MVSDEDFESMSPEEMAEYQRKSCVFCKIIAGEIPSRKVYEDDKIISILDINPATKGHLLLMTKEHYPILPVIPLDTASQMFRITKQLTKALKQAMVTGKATVFIANGAIAGQQSPHFLYHLIPREDNDGLDNFNVPQKDFSEQEVQQYLAPLKGKIGLMMRELKTRRKVGADDIKMAGIQPQPTSVSPATTTQTAPSALAPQMPALVSITANASSIDLAKFIEENPAVKDFIINSPEGFKKELEANPDINRLFAGININKLSEALKQLKKH
jgi:histidine triad (HIT) family protein